MKLILFIFSGLPASEKSVLAQFAAKQRNPVYLRINTVEQRLSDVCDMKVQGKGYRLSYRIAADNLHSGHNVVADSCNPIQMTRDRQPEIDYTEDRNDFSNCYQCKWKPEKKVKSSKTSSKAYPNSKPEVINSKNYTPFITNVE